MVDLPSDASAELGKLLAVGALLALAAGATYVVPAAADLRPWLPGEPVPVWHLLVARDGPTVAEDAFGEIGEAAPAQTPPPAVAAVVVLPDAPPPRLLPDRPPARATRVDHEELLAPWFEALAAVDAGTPGALVRALHWGDSTIAADGITGTVRERLQARFGDGGPGFVAVHADPRWQLRPGILRTQTGSWESLTITFGGAEAARYGLAGNVSTAVEEATVSLGGLKVDGARQPLARFDVYYQVRPEGGSFSAVPRGHKGARIATAGTRVVDGWRELLAPTGAPTLWIQAHGDGPVTLYGVAMETAGPGVTWETLGVAGSSVGSWTAYQPAGHIRGQVERRQPALLVYQTGGNELTYPSLLKGEGEDYEQAYRKVIGKMRAGAPTAACLLIGPLDQATRRRGEVVSKDNLDRMIGVQRRAADAEGCAFWDARAVMGGDGGFARWLGSTPRYAWTDLIHLNTEGLALVGDSLADALLDAYEAWREQHGALPGSGAPAAPEGGSP